MYDRVDHSVVLRVMGSDATFFGRVIDLYEEMPYPQVPLEETVDQGINELFKVSYMTSQYARTRELVNSEGTVMLNAGCGSGVETLILAEANPGATVVGIDLSLESVKVAERRLRYQGFTDTQFYAMDMLDLPELGIQFDFISCNDVLYLLDSPVDGLKAMKAVLKPEGIIRTNLHHVYNRRSMLEMQEAFRLLGLHDLPRRQAAQQVREFMTNLTKQSFQARSWDPNQYSDDSVIMNNYLLSGDKGFSILDTFAFLKESGLGMVNLVDYPNWGVTRLFQKTPKFVEERLEKLSQIDQLRLCELIFPNGRRLIDFWAEHEDSSLVFPWTDEQWLEGHVMINPVISKNPTFIEQLIQAFQGNNLLSFHWIGSPNGILTLPADKLSWLFILAEGPQPVKNLIQRCVEVNNVTESKASEEVLSYLQALEDFLFIFLWHPT